MNERIKEKILALRTRGPAASYNGLCNMFMQLCMVVMVNVLFWKISWLACVVLDLFVIGALATKSGGAGQ